MVVDVIFVGNNKSLKNKKPNYIKNYLNMTGITFFFSSVEVSKNPTEEERDKVLCEVLELVKKYKNKTHIVVFGLFDEIVFKLKQYQDQYKYTVEVVN